MRTVDLLLGEFAVLGHVWLSVVTVDLAELMELNRQGKVKIIA